MMQAAMGSPPEKRMARPSAKGRTTANSLTADTAENTSNALQAQTKTIHICHAAQGDGFDVVVKPVAPWNGIDRHNLPTIRAAKRAAESLSVVHGWKIADDTAGGAA